MTYPFKNLENFTLQRLVDRSLELFADNDSFGNVGESAMSYREFNARIHKMVALLQSKGIKEGDRVLLLSENMPNWSVAYFAVTYFGGVIVPVLPDFHPSDVHRIIEHSGARAAFVASRHEVTIDTCPESKIEFSINLNSLELINNRYGDDDSDTPNTHGSTTLYAPHEDDLAAIIYTSGTTGNSKGVMLSHKNLVTNAMSAYIQITVEPDDIFLSILPLAHTLEGTVGMIIPVLNGCSVFYVDKVPTPSVLLQALSIVRPTLMVSVPLIIEKIYKNKVLPKFTSSPLLNFLYGIGFFRKILNKAAGKKLIETFGGRIRFFGIGGAGISPFVEQFLIEAKFPFIVGYGLTETAPLLAGSVLGDTPKFKSTGIAMAGVELKIKNKDPKTGEGEILAKSPSLMMGYYKDEEKTAEVMEDGWFLTGDLGYIDEDGFLFISGRSKNMLLGPDGKNIYPEQVEAVINQNGLILDSLVMQDADGRLIAKIHLNYEVVDATDKEKIIAMLEGMRKEVNLQLSPSSRMVKFVEQEEDFIKTPTKKIKRFLYTDG